MSHRAAMVSLQNETDVFLSSFSSLYLQIQVFTLRCVMNNWFWSPWACGLHHQRGRLNPAMFEEKGFLPILASHEYKELLRGKTGEKPYKKLTPRTIGQKCKAVIVQSSSATWFWQPVSKLNSQHYLKFSIHYQFLFLNEIWISKYWRGVQMNEWKLEFFVHFSVKNHIAET